MEVVLLKKLEEVYIRKFALEERKDIIPSSIQEKTSLISKKKEDLQKLKNDFERFSRNEEELKKEVSEIEEAKTKVEARIDTIKTQKDYESLEKELQSIVDEEVLLRKKIAYTSGMKARQGKIYKEVEEEIGSFEENLENEKKELEKEYEVVLKKLKEVTKEEDKLLKGLEEDFIYKFQRIVKNKKNGVVPLIDNVCRGCHIILPTEFSNEVKREAQNLKFCPYCSRIVYYEEGSAQLDDATGMLSELI